MSQSLSNKKWVLPSVEADSIIDQLLINREINTKGDQKNFLHPPVPTLHSILPLSQIKKADFLKAVKLIKQAITDHSLIVVYGDYDVDGITATAVLFSKLKALGGNVSYYIPDRLTEGYGLNQSAIDKLKQQGLSVLITVDCGITNLEAVAYAKKQNITVIVTDHHQTGSMYPEADAIIHDDSLVGVSVSWILSKGVESALVPASKINYQENLDLVALGTIADLQPLLGKNRMFVYHGLREMNQNPCLGLRQLAIQSGLKLGAIGTYEVGFMLSPRLNASGRLYQATDALKLLLSYEELEATSLADMLCKLNTKRQELTSDSFDVALSQIDSSKNQKILVVSHEEWHEGIIGLIASKVKEKYYLPTIAISTKEKIAKASARSIKGFNIIAALQETKELLVDCGGHPMAAGFSIETDKISLFTERISHIASEKITTEMLSPFISIDAKISLSACDASLFAEIQKLAPFGIGNPEPIFMIEKAIIITVLPIGREKQHLKLKISDQDQQSMMTVVAFNFGKYLSQFSVGTPINLVVSLLENTWNGTTTLELKAIDFSFV